LPSRLDIDLADLDILRALAAITRSDQRRELAEKRIVLLRILALHDRPVADERRNVLGDALQGLWELVLILPR